MSNSISDIWTSNGKSISTGPGRPERMMWKACWKTKGTCAGSSTVVAHLVTGLAMRRDIDRLKIFLVQAGARRLTGDAEDRNAVGLG